MKNRKIYSIDRAVAKTVNLRLCNPTVRAIMVGLWKLSASASFVGMTGDQILDYCVKHNLWSTRQTSDKYITTWAYYVKTLKGLGVIETGTASVSGGEEFLTELELDEELSEEDAE